jgi:hypothetical protein
MNLERTNNAREPDDEQVKKALKFFDAILDEYENKPSKFRS